MAEVTIRATSLLEVIESVVEVSVEASAPPPQEVAQNIKLKIMITFFISECIR